MQIASLQRDQIDASSASEQARIREEVTSALREVQALRARSAIVREQVDLARDNLGIIQDLFAQGSMSILELFDAQAAYRQATSLEAAQEVDRVIAEYDLRWALGEQFTEFGP
jgi:outer membrane protein TolC